MFRPHGCRCGSEDVYVDTEGNWVIGVSSYEDPEERQVTFCPDCGVQLKGLSDEQKVAVRGVVAFGQACRVAFNWAKEKVRRAEAERVAHLRALQSPILNLTLGYSCIWCGHSWMLLGQEHHSATCPSLAMRPV